ncbi:MAG: 4a-hydroxytetrahydrobiopterin dehydratase [Chloroflexi bacterium]|nr:4a-hydroxytetrahydrobiopterin dehydratase [Chloroflexota bacterium]
MSSSLADRQCVPCRGGTPPLAAEEIASLLSQLGAGWQVEEQRKLIKSFRFKNFLQAVDFVQAITPVAEAEGHHPDLYVRWGEVRVYLWTHKINGLTESDFFMAAKIDRVYASRQ